MGPDIRLRPDSGGTLGPPGNSRSLGPPQSVSAAASSGFDWFRCNFGFAKLANDEFGRSCALLARVHPLAGRTAAWPATTHGRHSSQSARISSTLRHVLHSCCTALQCIACEGYQSGTAHLGKSASTPCGSQGHTVCAGIEVLRAPLPMVRSGAEG